jgi:hypothetical protein
MFNIILGTVFTYYGVVSLIELIFSIYITASDNQSLSYENVIFSTDTIHTMGFIAVILSAGIYITNEGVEQRKDKQQEN